MTRKLVVEGIGTFFLVLTIGMVIIEPGAGAFAPLAIGLVLMTMVYAGAHISGAHYNPAVTLAILLRGRATPTELGGYWAAQHIAALLAAMVVPIVKRDVMIVTTAPPVVPALVAELLFTFALVFVILNVATARGTYGNSYFGLAIGFTVGAGAFAVGPISGAAFNPAVAIGITLLGVLPVGSLWIYFVANLIGAVAAALVFNVLDLGDDKPTTATPLQQAELEGAAVPEG